MKQIIAVVKPFLAEKLVEALRRAPLEALTVREVKGYGRQKDQLDRYEQSEYALAFLPKVESTQKPPPTSTARRSWRSTPRRPARRRTTPGTAAGFVYVAVVMASSWQDGVPPPATVGSPRHRRDR